MAVTRLERKGRKNKNVAKNRVATMKRLNTIPSVKNVDIEEIKKEFAEKSKAGAAKAKNTEKKSSTKTDEVMPPEATEAAENKSKGDALKAEKKKAPVADVKNGDEVKDEAQEKSASKPKKKAPTKAKAEKEATNKKDVSEN
ncbi:MAG: hypothetical protein AAF616_07160 [Bacteroidota bacterium]